MSNNSVSGCLFDIYPLKDKMIFWIKEPNGNNTRLEQAWTHCIYVASDNKSNLLSLLSNNDILSLIQEYKFVSRYEQITDMKMKDVLKLTLLDSSTALKIGRKIEEIANEFGKFRLYNVDVSSAQSYFYEHDLFPLAYCHVDVTSSELKWKINDSTWSTDYNLPDFRKIKIKVNSATESGRIPTFTDEIESVIIKYEADEIIIDGNEKEILSQLMRQVREINPDFIFTDDGDTFIFPYLISRAEENQLDLVLDRELIPLTKPKNEGTSYFSYGRIYFKPTSTKLLGRVHIDTDTSFVLNESGLEGLYEIARICRMPLHTASRASIGKCLSSIQFYNATKKHILIPWKPTLTEHHKTLDELLVADRGGLILEPKMGVHQKAAELDFVSLYPSIMYKKNISAETVICDCCHNSKSRVPELSTYHVCEKKIGLVPTSLQIVLAKRKSYKLLKNSSINAVLKEKYNSRQNALKWILVTSFGYLGFNNAKFGRIDAHIAVCAFDRQILLQTIKIAENNGFQVLHGIVDSIWIQKQGAKKSEYFTLKQEIEQKTGFEILLEGEYRWIALMYSKENRSLPVHNRYFGLFDDGTLKIRGIEARRHDTPLFIQKFQQHILQIMSKGYNVKEVRELIPQIKICFQHYTNLLKEGKVPLQELVFSKRISKNYDEYQNRNTERNSALSMLSAENKQMRAGEILRYIVTDYYSKNPRRRTIPFDLVTHKTNYDIKRYTELLCESCKTVTEPFGFIVNNLIDSLLY
jgi:DNA polymerase, archaea type